MFKSEMFVENKCLSNQLVFATKAEAEAYAADLFMRWTMPSDKRAVEAPAGSVVNARWSDGQLVHLEVK